LFKSNRGPTPETGSRGWKETFYSLTKPSRGSNSETGSKSWKKLGEGKYEELYDPSKFFGRHKLVGFKLGFYWLDDQGNRKSHQ